MKYVVLLRGINVGGRNKLAMADLRRLIAEVGGGAADTYIQSGNAVCDTAFNADDLAQAIEDSHGFRPAVVLLDAAEFTTISSGCPFDLGDGKAVHVYIAGRPIVFDADGARALAAPSERVASGERAVYLSAPEGVARSKLAQTMDRFCDVPLTARNGNTMLKLWAMLS